MECFIRKQRYTGPIQAVVLDWAGTAVDYGCVGPAAVFVDVFADRGVAVSINDARRFMGLAKIDHIRQMCNLPSVSSAWKDTHGKFPGEDDVLALYDRTAELMVNTIHSHSDLIPGLLEAIATMRDSGIKIGTSTGYVKEMMEVLVPLARKKGYTPDAIVCSSDVPAGRPYPWMCYRNAILLETYPMEAMIKIGDTRTDIEEGLNAGMWTVGITKTGNELGLTEAEVAALDSRTLSRKLSSIESRFREAGAHYVIEQIGDVIPVVQDINERLANRETPLT